MRLEIKIAEKNVIVDPAANVLGDAPEMAKVEENVGDVPQMENARKGLRENTRKDLRENARKDPQVIAQKVDVEIGDVVTGKKTKAQLISQQTRSQSQKANQ